MNENEQQTYDKNEGDAMNNQGNPMNNQGDYMNNNGNPMNNEMNMNPDMQNQYNANPNQTDPNTFYNNNMNQYNAQNQMPDYQDYGVKQYGTGLSIACMVLGIVSLVFSCVYYISIPCAIVALVFAFICFRDKRPSKGMYVAGLVCAIIGLVFAVLVLIIGLSAINTLNSFSNYY